MNARNQMDPKFMWDFSHMFETKEAWEAAYAECEADIAKLSSLAGTLCASAESLKTGLDTVYAVSKKMELVYLYAMLHQSSDNGDPEYQAMQGRAINLIVAMNTSSSPSWPFTVRPSARSCAAVHICCPRSRK